MITPTLWLCAVALLVLLYIVEAIFDHPATNKFGPPLIFAAYAVGIVLFFKLGVWPALAVWWGIGVVMGVIRWSDEFRRVRRSKDAGVEPPSLAKLVRALFLWPVALPFVCLGGPVLYGLFTLYGKLRRNRVPHYKGIEECKQAAISGDARAQLTLGSAYESGEHGLLQDYAESVKWYRKAAEQSHGTAQLRLGICLAEGKGVEKNAVEGLMWISLSNFVLALHPPAEVWLPRLVRDAAEQASNRTKAQMTEQQIAEAWAMLDSSPLYKEFKERLDRSASQPAPEKSPPAQV